MEYLFNELSFNQSNNQILFHKSFDLVNSLVNRHADFINETKNFNTAKFNSSVKIDNKLIGIGQKTFIVAEAGLNHNGSFDIAKNLIDNSKKVQSELIKEFGTDIIDISGGLETSGLKDISKIEIFLNKIKNLNDEA